MANVPYSQLSSQPKSALAPRIPLPAPLALFVEFTNHCNFKCTFCPESLPDYKEQTGGIGKLSFDDFKKICADIQDLGGLKVLRFYNVGEPLLHPDATRMIKYAVDLGIAERTELTTNGSVLSRTKAEELIASGLDYARFSIYGATDESHSALTGSVVKTGTIAENIRYLRDRRNELGATRPVVYAKMVDPMIPEEVARFRARYESIADEVCIEPPHNWTGDESKDLIQITYGKTLEPHFKSRQKEVCPSPFYILALHADGEVSACCTDWQKGTSVGNVLTDSLKNIWHGDRMREFRRLHIERRRHEIPACRNCEFILTFPDNIDELTDPAILG